MSVAGLVCAFLFWPAGLALGIIGIVRTGRDGYRGRGLAVAATVVSAGSALLSVVLVAALVLLTGSDPAESAGEDPEAAAGGETDAPRADESVEPAPVPEPDDEPGGDAGDDAEERDRVIPVADLEVGDCLLEPALDDEGTIGEVRLVECVGSYDYQVVAVAELSGGPWPGEDEVETLADEACYAGAVDVLESEEAARLDLALSYYWPTRQSWAFGDREATCLVYSLDGPLSEPVLTGSPDTQPA